MANVKTFARSFSGGELSPEFVGRIDDVKYQTGAAILRNFISLPHGPVRNRAGFAYVNEVKDSTKRTRLIPFTFSTTQTVVIELGAGYFRFHTQGATILSGGVPYEIANTYAESELFDIHYVQSADVLTLVHPNHPPAELRRAGPTSWSLIDISFVSSLNAPGSVLATATTAAVPTGLRDYTYVVTAVGANGLNESIASTSSTCSNNLLQTGAFNTITWAAASPTPFRYNVYLQSNGLFGYIGNTDGLTFKDDLITPDLSRTPPIAANPFVGAGNYPGAVSYFEQRRCFAGSLNSPQTMWMTRSGTESNMNYSIPARDDDAITFRVAARDVNTIRHIIPLNDLVLLTSAAEWKVTSGSSDAITPSSVNVRPQSYIGANNVQPNVINTSLIYPAARGGHVREMGYSLQINGYQTGDLSLRAAHLFDGLNILDMCYSKSPQPVLWFVSSNGNLLGFTYVPEQQIGAWHHHDTDGIFESVTSVAEGDEDIVYAVVNRTIDGAQKRYVERMTSRAVGDMADMFFVDSGSTYSGSPATTISGLDHLEGKLLNILADGAVHPQRTVVDGAITLDRAASKVQAGLPITADIQTLPASLQVDGAFGQGRFKNVNKVWLRVYNSRGVFAGPSFTELVEAKQRTTEDYGTPPNLISAELDVTIAGAWDSDGAVCIRQKDPLPLTIISIAYEIALGG